MKPIQIESAKKSNVREDLEEIIIGIDLGTTNSLAVFYETEEKSKILLDVSPSVVTFFEDGSFVSCDLSYALRNEGVTVSSVKRKIGKKSDDIVAFGKIYSPEEVSAIILKHIKTKCEQVLEKKISKAVITVPAYFDDTQRNATKEAAKMAGLEVLRLLNEPTAAAVFYDIDNKEEGIYAVFDLGGGTFDISILQMKMGVIKVIAVGGDAELGGDDFDEILANHFSVSPLKARKIKEEICVNGLYKGENGEMTRDEFDEKVLPLVHKLVRIFKNTILDSELKINDLKGIILVGGSTKMPIIKEAITFEFKTKIFDEIDPDRIVAFGAALHAFNLQNKTGNLLLDVVPLTLGMETVAGMVLKMIPRNSSIPMEKTEELTTGEDNQTGIILHVVQGEREFVKDCRSLGNFLLTGIPPMPKGVPQVIVSFKVDVDGILSVSAKEQISGVETEIEIRPTYNLAHKDIRKMFEDAMKNGKEDMQKRVLEETKLEAKSVLFAAKEYSAKYKVNTLDSLILSLQEAINSNSETQIKQVIDEIRAKLN